MIEVLKQAFEALKDVGVLTDREWQAVHKNKANELRQSIAELESQEPVAWMDADGNVSDNNDHKCFPIPLYTHLPQRTWVGLTDEEVNNAIKEKNISPLFTYRMIARTIESKLRQKNT
jgi:hypothetical protein